MKGERGRCSSRAMDGVALGRCPGCRGQWRSLGFVLCDGTYLRRLQCSVCGQRRDDAQTRLQVIAGGGEAVSGLSAEDRETIQIIALLMGGGGLSLREMDVSEVAVTQFEKEHGPPAACLRGFAFPAFCWPLPREGGDDRTLWLVVIDQGRKRVSFRVRRRGAGFPG